MISSSFRVRTYTIITEKRTLAEEMTGFEKTGFEEGKFHSMVGLYKRQFLKIGVTLNAWRRLISVQGSF